MNSAKWEDLETELGLEAGERNKLRRKDWSAEGGGFGDIPRTLLQAPDVSTAA